MQEHVCDGSFHNLIDFGYLFLTFTKSGNPPKLHPVKNTVLPLYSVHHKAT